MNKPVWRINTGNGVPSDLGGEIQFYDGAINKYSFHDDFSTNGKLWSIAGTGMPFDVYAYQTNRTKPAKYDRVVCGVCCGLGDAIFYELKLDAKLPVVISEVDMQPLRYKDFQTETIRKCPRCNGNGYVMVRLTE